MSRRIRMTFPKATIKAIMQMDDEVGKMSAEVPLMVSRCVELFLEELVKAASAVAAERSCNIVQPGHLKQCVANSSMFDFLRPLLEHVPDLGPAQEKKPKAQKARKPKSEVAEQKPKKVKTEVDTAPVVKPEPTASGVVDVPLPNEEAPVEEVAVPPEEAPEPSDADLLGVAGDDADEDDNWDEED